MNNQDYNLIKITTPIRGEVAISSHDLLPYKQVPDSPTLA